MIDTSADAQASFTALDRSIGDEDEIQLTSVGIDIGSATCHLVFSEIVLERQGNRYVPSARTLLYESDVILTPYASETEIDREQLEKFVLEQYRAAGIEPAAVDTGALILTGVALLRHNSRVVAEVFAASSGRLVAVSAGDNLEATMAAYGSGATSLSESLGAVLNVDIGGGTTKVALCREGRVSELMTMDVGARLVAFQEDGRIVRLEESGRRIATRLGIDLDVGGFITRLQCQFLARSMVDELLGEVSASGVSQGSPLLRSPALQDRTGIREVTFSGGVSEYVYERTSADFGDLGPFIGEELRSRSAAFGAPIRTPPNGIRATVIGAAQYTVQVSGATIYLSSLDIVPVRNVPVVSPRIPWHDGPLTPAVVERAASSSLRSVDGDDGAVPVAISVSWAVSATFDNLESFCRGVVEAMRAHLDMGNPLIIVCDNDVGGLIGLHIEQETELDIGIISIDGIELRELDYIDIGAVIPSSGAVPVVVKSLVFSPIGDDSSQVGTSALGDGHG